MPAQRSNRPHWLWEFFDARNIGPKTVEHFGIYAVRRRFPDPVGESDAIVFPFTYRGEVVNRKYRPYPAKNPMMQERDALQTLYNVDALGEEPAEVIWVEGEPDCMALYEAGFPHAVTLKDGAPSSVNSGNEKRFAALATHADMLAKVPKIILAGDMDAPGLALREELAQPILRELNLPLDERGRVPINDHFETPAVGVYAIGDVVRGPMLAHKGEEEGIACVEMLAGQHGHVNYAAIPWVVYTHPEIAGVGLTETQARARGDVKIGKFAFRANGRALAVDEADGFVKVIADARTDRVLGVHIIGPRASEMIAEPAAVMEYAGTSEDIARTCHAHPTLPETLKEAALAVSKRQLHL